MGASEKRVVVAGSNPRPRRPLRRSPHLASIRNPRQAPRQRRRQRVSFPSLFTSSPIPFFATKLAKFHCAVCNTSISILIIVSVDFTVLRDWYNLEKSKRVKAFRCGEFDDCIEKAEAAQGGPLKKREKYARREDAILHALELEKQISKKPGKSSASSLNAVKKVAVAVASPPETLGNDNENHANLNVYCENETGGGSFPSEVAKDGNQLHVEVDYSETTPRMRDLQDFGLRIAPAKKNLSSSVDPYFSQKRIVDDGARALASGGGIRTGSALLMNGKIL